MAALAAAAAQRRRADAPVLLPTPLVQGQQVPRLLAGHGGAPVGGLARLLADLGQGGVAARGDGLALRGDLRLLGRGRIPAALGGLLPLHHVQHDLFQVVLAARERDDLRLQVLQLARRRHLPGVEPLAVAVDAGPHLLHVRLGLDLRAPQVALLGLEGRHGVTQLRVALFQPVQLGVLGESPATVLEPAQLGVQVGQLEQPLLRLGRCFHGSPR